MDPKTRQYVTELGFKVTRLEKSQTRDHEMLQNLSKMAISADILKKKTSEIENNITKRDSEILQLKEEERKILAGESKMPEIVFVQEKRTKPSRSANMNMNNNRQSRPQEKPPAKPLKPPTKSSTAPSSNSDKKTEPPVHSKYYDDGHSERSHRHKEKQLDRDIRYHYGNYCRINDSLPEYMRNNLAEMPNNKGYIWRNCWFFGLLDEEPGQPMVLFEKKHQVMRIHEYDRFEYRLFEKVGKEKRNLIFKRPRVFKKLRGGRR